MSSEKVQFMISYAKVLALLGLVFPVTSVVALRLVGFEVAPYSVSARIAIDVFVICTLFLSTIVGGFAGLAGRRTASPRLVKTWLAIPIVLALICPLRTQSSALYYSALGIACVAGWRSIDRVQEQG